MDGLPRSSTARRLRARATRAALVAVMALIGLLASPGTALAVGEVTPVLDCVRQNPNGTYTAVLGYTNKASVPITVPLGSRNRVAPSSQDGRQPTTFQPGTQRGAFTITLTSTEYARSGNYWTVDGKLAYIGQVLAPNAATCPASTELPEEGNGTGPAIGLAAAGVLGAVLVHRARKRALTVTGRGDA